MENDLISKLSEIRSKYNCFDDDEAQFYRALSEAIRILSQRADGDTISRAEAIDAVISLCDDCDSGYCGSCRVNYPGEKDARKALEDLPSAQSDRDIPKKPNETTDRTWGIPHRQAVCPNCDRYIGTTYFIGDGKRKVSYCDSCGQAIDWSDWRYEDE